MIEKVLFDPSFLEFLRKLDRDLAEIEQAKGCRWCGSPLHWANYVRLPRGVPEARRAQVRFSLCCAREGCRRRTTPPSMRFLGRRSYLGAAVLLVSAMHHGAQPSRMARVRERLGVRPRTLARWRLWWREIFPLTRFWRVGRTGFVPPCDVAALPASLLQRFTGTALEQLVHALAYLEPLTGGTPDEPRLLRAG